MRHHEYPHIHFKHTIRLIKWALHPDGKREITDIMEFDGIAGARRRFKKIMRSNDRYDLKTFPGCSFVITEERTPAIHIADNISWKDWPKRVFKPHGRVITPTA